MDKKYFLFFCDLDSTFEAYKKSDEFGTEFQQFSKFVKFVQKFETELNCKVVIHFISGVDRQDLLSRLKYFDSNPKTGGAFALIPVIFSYFQNLMLAYYAPNRQNDAEVARWLDLRGPWAAKEYMLGMRNYSGGKVMQIIDKIREADTKCKGLDNPNTPTGELLQELIFFIMH